MPKQPVVVLFGNSLLMDTVEASLEDQKELGILRMVTTISDVDERLQALAPDLIIFDMDVNLSDVVMPLLFSQPGTPFLGLDIDSGKAVVLSSQQQAVMTLKDLTRVIRTQTDRRSKAVQPVALHFGKGVV
ncbi:MAG: hypothetical protein JXD18_11405 [Anaerolineae bacterium]|nr:hypothetical protein [Anaerolineae bacterium]